MCVVANIYKWVNTYDDKLIFALHIKNKLSDEDVSKDISTLIDVKLYKNGLMKVSPDKAGNNVCNLKSSHTSDVHIDDKGQKINV
jgi:hypothetical protein